MKEDYKEIERLLDISIKTCGGRYAETVKREAQIDSSVSQLCGIEYKTTAENIWKFWGHTSSVIGWITKENGPSTYGSKYLVNLESFDPAEAIALRIRMLYSIIVSGCKKAENWFPLLPEHEEYDVIEILKHELCHQLRMYRDIKAITQHTKLLYSNINQCEHLINEVVDRIYKHISELKANDRHGYTLSTGYRIVCSLDDHLSHRHAIYVNFYKANELVSTSGKICLHGESLSYTKEEGVHVIIDNLGDGSDSHQKHNDERIYPYVFNLPLCQLKNYIKNLIIVYHALTGRTEDEIDQLFKKIIQMIYCPPGRTMQSPVALKYKHKKVQIAGNCAVKNTQPGLYRRLLLGENDALYTYVREYERFIISKYKDRDKGKNLSVSSYPPVADLQIKEMKNFKSGLFSMRSPSIEGITSRGPKKAPSREENELKNNIFYKNDNLKREESCENFNEIQRMVLSGNYQLLEKQEISKKDLCAVSKDNYSLLELAILSDSKETVHAVYELAKLHKCFSFFMTHTAIRGSKRESINDILIRYKYIINNPDIYSLITKMKDPKTQNQELHRSSSFGEKKNYNMSSPSHNLGANEEVSLGTTAGRSIRQRDSITTYRDCILSSSFNKQQSENNKELLDTQDSEESSPRKSCCPCSIL